MSRIPSHPHYAHPPPQPPPPQPMYHGHPGSQPQPPTIPPLHPPSYAQDPNVYAFGRDGQGGVGGRPTGDWSNDPEPMYHKSSAGPSRVGDSYASYPQPGQYRTSPPNTASGRSGTTHPGPGGQGWSSVHPSAASVSLSRPDSGNRPTVKLEDLVSQDRVRPGTGAKPIPTGAGGAAGLTSHPLSAAHSSERPSRSSSNMVNGASLTANGGGGPQAGESSTGGGGNQQSGPSEFIKKLYKMLEEESAMFGKARGSARGEGAKRGSVGWGRGGTSFVVWDMHEFTTKVLPQTFRHSNFSSFVRQLNKYGFSKIKHMDDDSGQIKENVWEFQHPSFQAGGKADLDSIKRKVVAPKKGGGDADNDENSPARLNTEDAGRILEMENRLMGLEDQLARTLEDVQESRTREMGMMSVMREMINQLAGMDRATGASPARENEVSPRIVHLFQMFDQVASSSSRIPPPNFSLPIFPPPPPIQSMQYNPSVRLPALVNPNMPLPVNPLNPINHSSPHGTDSGSRKGDGPSPAGSKVSVHPPPTQQVMQDQPDDVIKVPSGTNKTQTANPNQTLYNGEPLDTNPIFADTPAWLTEGTTAPIPIYHRRSSDGAALRIMMEALTSQPPATTPAPIRFDNGSASDQMVTAPQSGPVQAAAVSTAAPTIPNGTAPAPPTNPQVTATDVVAAASSTPATIQPPPFGTLVIPDATETTVTVPSPESNAIKIRRGTTFRPHWTQTPRILVVEDDVVYRQLSSKFLEKFGCVTETVEDAQGAVEKMNRTKYDLVLMDIFFGPSMDGRKATSLIRQFDIYTPIISMTSNVQTQDVDSYLQSGMNDVLAKPFTKNGLFGILDKHLIHLKAIQLSAQVPRSLGLPPLSDQGVADAVATGAAQWSQADEIALRNPLAAMGWSDETYQLVLQQFLATGSMPDISTISNGAIGTSVVFGDSAGFNRKRSIETLDDDWTPPGTGTGAGTGMGNGVVGGGGVGNMLNVGNVVTSNGIGVGGGGMVQQQVVMDGQPMKKAKK